jgi:hypothetical protein
MMTALALCMHMYAFKTASGQGHSISRCTDAGGVGATFLNDSDPAATNHVGFFMRPTSGDGWDAALAKINGDRARLAGAGAVTYANAWARIVVVVPAPRPWMSGWVDRVGAICSARADLPLAQAELAREKANPSGVVDLVRLHDLGQRIQGDQDMGKAPGYKDTYGVDFPSDVCSP